MDMFDKLRSCRYYLWNYGIDRRELWRLFLTAQETRIIALEREPTDLFCAPPSGSQATWYFNEEPVRNQGRPYRISRDRLTVMTPTLAEAGRYTCIDPDQTPTDLFSIDYILVVQCKLTCVKN